MKIKIFLLFVLSAFVILGFEYAGPILWRFLDSLPDNQFGAALVLLSVMAVLGWVGISELLTSMLNNEKKRHATKITSEKKIDINFKKDDVNFYDLVRSPFKRYL